MNYEAASLSLDFENVWSQLTHTLRSQFGRSGLQLASTWAHLLPAGSSEDDAYSAFSSFLPQMGLSEGDEQAMGACLALWSAACGGREGVIHRCARLTPLQVAADKATYAKRTAEAREQADLQRLALASLAHLPREWRGKRYRRTEGQSTEHAREEGERQERLRQGRQVAALLVEAGLPFARALGAQALDQEAPLRCCRGLPPDAQGCATCEVSGAQGRAGPSAR